MVSRGSVTVEVTDLTGRTPREAASVLASARLRAEELTYADEGAEADGVVMRQDPLAGALAPHGSVVNLRLDEAAQDLERPDVRADSLGRGATYRILDMIALQPEWLCAAARTAA